jgi:hypothetical protein
MDSNARPSLSVVMVLALSLLTPVMRAQEEKSEEATPRARAISPEVASLLAAGMPKYNPPKPVEPKSEEELVDRREIDRPRNQIIRLPDVVVQEKKPPVFRERDIYTRKGLADLAKQRYFSEGAKALNRYKLPLFGQGMEAYALQMWADDERLQNIADLQDTAAAVESADPENASYIRRATADTYIRRSDFGYQPRR